MKEESAQAIDHFQYTYVPTKRYQGALHGSLQSASEGIAELRNRRQYEQFDTISLSRSSKYTDPVQRYTFQKRKWKSWKSSNILKNTSVYISWNARFVGGEQEEPIQNDKKENTVPIDIKSQRSEYS